MKTPITSQSLKAAGWKAEDRGSYSLKLPSGGNGEFHVVAIKYGKQWLASLANTYGENEQSEVIITSRRFETIEQLNELIRVLKGEPA